MLQIHPMLDNCIVQVAWLPPLSAQPTCVRGHLTKYISPNVEQKPALNIAPLKIDKLSSESDFGLLFELWIFF